MDFDAFPAELVPIAQATHSQWGGKIGFSIHSGAEGPGLIVHAPEDGSVDMRELSASLTDAFAQAGIPPRFVVLRTSTPRFVPRQEGGGR